MYWWRKVRSAVALALLCSAGGCASIACGRYADVTLEGTPQNAHVTVLNHTGAEVASAYTPAVVSLRRNRKFFLPARYTARFDAPGYETAEVPIRSTVNPWIAGNIVIGGLVGLVVDNATGAVWKPKQSLIAQHLTPAVGYPNMYTGSGSEMHTVQANVPKAAQYSMPGTPTATGATATMDPTLPGSLVRTAQAAVLPTAATTPSPAEPAATRWTNP